MMAVQLRAIALPWRTLIAASLARKPKIAADGEGGFPCVQWSHYLTDVAGKSPEKALLGSEPGLTVVDVEVIRDCLELGDGKANIHFFDEAERSLLTKHVELTVEAVTIF